MKKISFLVMIFGVLLLLPLVSGLVLTVNSPVNSTLNTRTVAVDLSSDATANFYYIKDINSPGNWILLCRADLTCVTTIQLSNGVNKPSFKAVSLADGSSDIKDSITIKIDTLKPVIKKISPNTNAFVNGLSGFFNITYTEENLNRITFYYGTSNDSDEMNGSCASGKDKICSFNPPLNAFDGQAINFSFMVLDTAGNNRTSKTNNVRVDLTNPSFSFTKSIDKTKVTFIFNVTEINFNKIVFMDLKDARPTWKTLCSNLIVGRCYTYRTFSYGEHNLNIKVLDRAGNSANQSTSFTI